MNPHHYQKGGNDNTNDHTTALDMVEYTLKTSSNANGQHG
jgi:hypothetical protein